jgi:glutamyl-tRNA synthetase
MHFDITGKRMTLKTRFAPSPTGRMHIGNARTALFNALLAKAAGGTFLLRIEDTDTDRSLSEHTDGILEDLTWLGLTWDEGPFAQMERLSIYAHYSQILQEKGLAYPCFCSEAELALSRKTQLSSGQPPRYAGTCRHLTEAEQRQKKQEGRHACLRLAVPEDATIHFVDLIYGPKAFKAFDLGDFVIGKDDGGPTFLFANAIDDALMEVTHALRGEDHLTNTPRQILILQLLGLTPPQYGHFPIILGQDGKPLSKRNGSQSIQTLREQGFCQEALVNYMARLGHHYTDEGWMSFAELGQRFSLEHMGRSAARYDGAQLLFWQKQTLSRLNRDALFSWLRPARTTHPDVEWAQLMPLIQDNILLPQDATLWVENLSATTYVFEGEALQVMQNTPILYWETALAALKTHGIDAKTILETLKVRLSLKGKLLFMPLRLALTGQLQGPQLQDIMTYLGQTRVAQKLSHASAGGHPV